MNNSENTSLLAQELEPLKAQIEQTQGKLEVFEDELRAVEAELNEFSDDQQRFGLLRDVCDALDKLGELGASDLFWEAMPEVKNAAEPIEKLRGRIAEFEGEIRGTQEKRESIRAQVDQCQDELDDLHEEVRQAHAREERRLEEFLIEREVSQVSYRPMNMPWATDGESERPFRRALLVALLLCIIFGYLIPLVTVPVPDRTTEPVKIPERLAMLVKKEPPKPKPVPKKLEEEKKPKSEQEKEKSEKEAAKGSPKKGPEEKQPKAGPAGPKGTQLARQKAESSGVLAFKNSFADLMKETPVAKVGTETHLRTGAPRAAGQAQARRSLVALQGGSGGSGGISNAGISTNLGSGNGGGGGNGIANQIGGVGFTHVESAVAGLQEEKGRPLSDGPGPGR
ncbi:MAG: hypothetical protein P8Y63_09255, partial [Deltaproteobacteria bacterium]